MNLNQPADRTHSLFQDDEPVIQSHPLLPREDRRTVRVPRFGDADVWDFNGVLRRPANRSASYWRVRFSKALADPPWNLLAREVFMIMLNPRHEALHAVGIHLRADRVDLRSVIEAASLLRRLVFWARCNGLPEDPSQWTVVDLRRQVANLLEEGKTAITYVIFLKRMAVLGPALSAGWPAGDPWPGRSARRVVNKPGRNELSTKAIQPEIWFPLVRAAWAYIHTFAPDILNATRIYDDLRQAGSLSITGKEEQVDAWLANPANKIPIYPTKTLADGSPRINWRLLDLRVGLLGRWREKSGQKANSSLANSPSRRARAIQAVTQGRFTSEGLVPGLRHVTRADRTTGPWHPGIQPQDLFMLTITLRNAAFVLVVALSMMRDSEIHAITRGSVVEHYNSPAIASTLQKGNANLPRKHWWIIEPVAEAITVAEAVSVHAERVFAPLHQPHLNEAVLGTRMVTRLIEFANAGRDWSGLEEIPPGAARPHMFRRTMAMLTDQFPGSEIALGIQLKHAATRALANRATQSYAASDVAWADHLESAIDAARFRRIKDLYGLHKAGEPIGFGPGAARVREAFDEIQSEVTARGGDAQVEESLLRKARITIRFGTLNNCLFDQANPAGAVCLENAIIPPGHTGPLEERCRPDRCRNSMIGIEHVAIHDAHRRTQLKLLETPRLPPARKALITRELDRVEAVLNNVREESS